MLSYLELLTIKLLLKCLYRLRYDNSLQGLKFIMGHILENILYFVINVSIQRNSCF